MNQNLRISDISAVQLLNSDECDQVVNSCDPLAWHTSTREVASSDDLLAGWERDRFVDLEHKSRTEQPVTNLELVTSIASQVAGVNDSVYHFNISELEPLRVLRYQPGDHFVHHTDLGAIHPGRKLAFTLMLSDDFTGGELDFFDGALPLAKGMLCIWPAFLRHGVKKIEQGTRYVIVGWVLGPSFV